MILDDGKSVRKSLILLSLAIIAFCWGDATVAKGEKLTLLLINVTVAKPENLGYIVLIIFAWLVYRFIQSQDKLVGHISNDVKEFTKKAILEEFNRNNSNEPFGPKTEKDKSKQSIPFQDSGKYGRYLPAPNFNKITSFFLTSWQLKKADFLLINSKSGEHLKCEDTTEYDGRVSWSQAMRLSLKVQKYLVRHSHALAQWLITWLVAFTAIVFSALQFLAPH